MQYNIQACYTTILYHTDLPLCSDAALQQVLAQRMAIDDTVGRRRRRCHHHGQVVVIVVVVMVVVVIHG